MRPSNTSCLAPTQGPLSSPQIAVTPAFPQLPALGALVALRQAPGNSNEWYAVLQQGLIVRFDNTESVSATSVFLDIQSQVLFSGEQGLLGMAFHPDYVKNGEIFVYYTTNTPSLRSNVSRFRYVNNAWEEQIILSIAQPYANHNGGNILFGPDGYLYIGLGDGGSANDPNGNGQNTLTLLGSMLRINVDLGTPYAIPNDNPFAGNALCNDPAVVVNTQSCPEIYAYGLRNPWRWSFDRVSQKLWLGDVGQGQVEEIDIVSAGNNYGWNVMEGSQCLAGGTGCNPNGSLTLPVAEYLHSGGSAAVVGGYVYRGNNNSLASLYGSYMFADTYSGQIYKTTKEDTVYLTQPLVDTGLLIYSFAEGLDGEIYILAYSGSGTGNNIYKFTPVTNPPATSPIPELLSETGCFTSTNPLIANNGVIPYDVLSPLWSDGALKQRYFAIPDGSHIQLANDGDFIFPVGSVLIKTFYLNDKPVETRLMMRHADYWGGYSYEWQYDATGTPVDAQLLTDTLTKDINGQSWLYPSRDQCFNCHTQAANIALGLETIQLNKNYMYPQTATTENQLVHYQSLDLLAVPLTDDQLSAQLYTLNDDSVSHELRAKSYLHSNCSQCHRPGGTTPTNIDFRFTTPLVEMQICNIAPSAGDLGIPGIKILDPLGTFLQPNSVLVERMESTDVTVRMPPLATAIPHEDAMSVIKSWIDELTSCSPI